MGRGEEPLRILFDGYWWVDGPPSNSHVMRETIAEWLRQFPQDRLAVVVPEKHRAAVAAESAGRYAVLGTRVWPHGASNMTALSELAFRWEPDVVYTQNYCVPVAPRGTLTVVFLHDVLFRTNPEWFTVAERLYFSPMPRLARRADLVLTSSATEAGRIRRETGATDIVPVGIGMSTELQEAAPSRPEAIPACSPFLLTVGRLNVRKNLGGVIAAALTSGAISPARPLVVVGGADGKAEEMSPEVDAAMASGAIRFTGHVTDGELVWLYKHTDLFLFLSRGEGYGMPPVEARFFGAPCLVSDLDVLREILPDDIARVHPDDVDAAANAIRELLGDQKTPRGLIDPPSWSQTVRTTREAILERRGR
ncbi:putative glycosyltransferase [Mobilicoccus pelagius NBRC 104925]|uniref:Putative glycosyltransferase n=2 Tax=Mobilicoccus TaxID=984996 RepID=H5USE6_9MICO|nr:putative glycosyltransferase [Mobilicoccus pelagius NBRC 104925]